MRARRSASGRARPERSRSSARCWMWERSSSSSSAFICERWNNAAMRERSESRSFLLSFYRICYNPVLQRLSTHCGTDGIHESIPVGGLLAQASAARGSKFIKLGPPIVFRRPPTRLEESLPHKAKQPGIQRTLFDQQRVAGDLSDTQQNAVPVERPQGHRAQNQHIESSRKQLSLVGHQPS